MPLVPIKLPPGLYRNGTEYSAKNRWREAQLVRFRSGEPCPIGGWKAVVMTLGAVPMPNGLDGIARDMMTWRANDQSRWVAVGTSRKLYAYDGGAFTDITPSGFVVGSDDVAVGKGYGAYIYGDDTYGTPRTVSSITSEPGRWTLDTWGETLLAVANSDGRICQWSLTGIATPLANAPTSCRSLIVTNERHVMALGAGEGPIGGGPGVYTPDPRHVWWCSREDLADWARDDPLNTAGDFRLDTPGQITRGLRFGGDVFIFTDQDVHRCQYLGPPYVYGFTKLEDGCGLIGPNAVAVAPTMFAWMGDNGFFVFDGYVKPLECEVLDFVMRDLSRLQAAKVHAGLNAAFNEIWWWYPSASATECDSYVVWNYAENHWTTGRMARTAWTDATVWPLPLAMEGFRADGVTHSRMYQHESGWLDDHDSRAVWIETGPIEIGNGDTRAVVDRVYQDMSPFLIAPSAAGRAAAPTPVPAFELSFIVRNAPGADETTFGPYTIDVERGYTDVRFNARQTIMRVDQIVDGNWILGAIRLNLKQGSGR